MPDRSAAATFLLLAISVAALSFAALDMTTALVSCALGAATIAIAISDARRLIVPDVLSLPLIPAGLLATWLLSDAELAGALVLEHVVAAGVAAAALLAIRHVYFRWRRQEGLGLGDVKLAAAAGAWTGLEGIADVLLLACLVAIAFVLIVHARSRTRLDGSAAIPLGAFLAPAIWLVWCAGALAAAAGGVPALLARLTMAVG